MDLQKIKKNIENGAIRTTSEFQRDIMLMFLNATMYNTHDHNVYHMAHHMMKDAVSTIQVCFPYSLDSSYFVQRQYHNK